jgi:hypothetical protein
MLTVERLRDATEKSLDDSVHTASIADVFYERADRVLQQRCVFARHPFMNLQVALCLLLETRGNPGNQNKRYENHWSYSSAFSSLTKREFHASHPEETAGDDVASVQPEKSFSKNGDCRNR